MAIAKADSIALLDTTIISRAAMDSFAKLNPISLMRNPVIFVTEVVAALTTFIGIEALSTGKPAAFPLAIAVWLWLTVLFATFAEAVAEGRGRARAESLRRTRTDLMAKVLLNPKDRARTKPTAASELRAGTLVLVETNDLIPSDGEIVEGVASVNESAITGESAPVIREAGGDRSAVTGGTMVVSDWLIIRITAEPGNTFIDRMIKLVEGAERRKTPNEIALDILLAGLTIIFLVAVVTLVGFAQYSSTPLGIPVLAALLVTLIPTTIGGLLSAIGIAGMDRLIRFNVVATSGRAVEAAGDVDALLLDKTGTITFGNRMAAGLYPVPGVTERELAEAAVRASLGDDTPEGRSILSLVRDRHGFTTERPDDAAVIPFTAQTRVLWPRPRGPNLAERRCRQHPETDARCPARAIHAICGTRRTRRQHAARRHPGQPSARRHRVEGHRQAGHSGAFLRIAPHGHTHRHGHRRQPHYRGGHRHRSRRGRLHRGGNAAG